MLRIIYKIFLVSSLEVVFIASPSIASANCSLALSKGSYQIEAQDGDGRGRLRTFDGVFQVADIFSCPEKGGTCFILTLRFQGDAGTSRVDGVFRGARMSFARTERDFKQNYIGVCSSNSIAGSYTGMGVLDPNLAEFSIFK
jgi:hypothetical protein